VIVNHDCGEYVNADSFHTNNIENFWSLFKRGVIGIYHYISEKHLQRYCEEFGYRYNTRTTLDSERFTQTLARCEGRLKYIDLIGKIPLPPKDFNVDTETGEVIES
jgi:hypothetical protein